MKKYINYSFCYALMAMAGGVFYREFTKFLGFTDVTALGKVHVHFFLLGMVVFLLVALFAGQYDLEKQKHFQLFMILYNMGVPMVGILMLVRGILQVLGTPLSSGADAAISGIAGIGHILTGVGLVLLLIILKKAAADAAKAAQ